MPAHMKTSTFHFSASDGKNLFVREWQPTKAPKAIVQIAHGMAEHSQRYQWVAEQLTAAGYAVFANDHRGHGETPNLQALPHGFFAPENGWQRVVDDLQELNHYIGQQHPGLPIILLGHSMGSHLAQSYVRQYGETLAGALISGSNGKTTPLRYPGQALANFLRRFQGRKGISSLMGVVSYDEFNKPFDKPKGSAKTDFDWLSRDQHQVEAYIADPWCGFLCTNAFWCDLFAGIADNENDSNLAAIPQQLPVYLITGSEDSSNNAEQGVRSLEKRYKKAGLSDVTVTVYEGGRHEMYNEINRDEVIADTLNWLNRVSAA